MPHFLTRLRVARAKESLARQWVTSAVDGLRIAEAALARLSRSPVKPPEDLPERTFGADRWANFDEELKRELSARLLSQHPSMAPFQCLRAKAPGGGG